MKPGERFEAKAADVIPALRDAAKAAGLALTRLGLAVPVQGNRWAGRERQLVFVSDGDHALEWRCESLSGLFRGDAKPPADMDHYPPEYTPLFFHVEEHLMTFCHALGDKTDQEFQEVYTTLRRRPDSRSLGPLHDFAWQTAAVMLATRVVSQAEFEALFGALAHSAKGWAQRPISRNYMAYLRQNIDPD